MNPDSLFGTIFVIRSGKMFYLLFPPAIQPFRLASLSLIEFGHLFSGHFVRVLSLIKPVGQSTVSESPSTDIVGKAGQSLPLMVG